MQLTSHTRERREAFFDFRPSSLTLTRENTSLSIRPRPNFPSQIISSVQLKRALNMTSSRIAELACTIQSKVAKLESHFLSHDMPFPSFEANAPLFLSLPPEQAFQRTSILEATDELHALMKGPIETVTDIAAGSPHPKPGQDSKLTQALSGKRLLESASHRAVSDCL